jgi:hypothetical protein
MEKLNGQPLKRESMVRVIDIRTATDASQDGRGAVVYLPESDMSLKPEVLEAAKSALAWNMNAQAVPLALH